MSPWDAIVNEAAQDSPLWAGMIRPVAEQEREPVFSLLAEARLAAALETIYEAYLVHRGRARLFALRDSSTALLLGDYLYARGLARAHALHEPRLTSDLSELISLLGHLHSDGRRDDALLWAATAAATGHPDLPSARGLFATTGETAPLEALLRREADEQAVERALRAHQVRIEDTVEPT